MSASQSMFGSLWNIVVAKISEDSPEKTRKTIEERICERDEF